MNTEKVKCIICEREFERRIRIKYPRQKNGGKSVMKRGQLTCSRRCSRIYIRIYDRMRRESVYYHNSDKKRKMKRSWRSLKKHAK